MFANLDNDINPMIEQRHQRRNRVIPLKKLKLLLFIFSGSIMNGMMGLMIQVSYSYSSKLSGGQILLMRSLVILLAYCILARYRRMNICNLNDRNMVMIAIICITSTLGFWCLFMSMKYLTTSISLSIFSLSVIFMGISAVWVLNARITLSNILIISTALFSVLIIGIGNNLISKDSTSGVYGAAYALGAAMLICISRTVMTRNQQYIHPIIVSIYLWITSILFWLLLFIISEEQLNYEALLDLGLIWRLLFVGIFSLLGQLLLTSSLKYGNTSMIVPILYFSVVLNLFFDEFYFNQSIHWLEYIGSIIILLCLICSAWYKYRETHRYNQ